MGKAGRVWNGGKMIFLFLFLSLNFLANSDDLVSLEFLFLCSVFFDLCSFLSVLVSTKIWVTDLSSSHSKSSTGVDLHWE